MSITFFSWVDTAVKVMIVLWILMVGSILALYFTLGKFKNW